MDELRPLWPDAPRRAPDLEFTPYRFIPGHHPRPEERSYDDPFAAGVDLYHQGYLWEAHEAWEAVYKSGGDRRHVQGLIQLAAMLLKAHIGNEAGVEKLYRKCRANLEGDADLVAQIDRWYAAREDPPRLQ